CQNYGSIIRNWGNNLTSEGLTLWRNAVYMLAGLEVPTELVQSSVGVNKVQSEASVTVYPSITSGTFTVEFANEPGMITVYNLSGKVIKQVVPSSSKENISIDGSGLYIIKAESAGVSKLFKVVKTN
ncbi:T9SS type A sorting domain-containing protein, partial [Saccharicrinis sp. FJH2]|uniref:T9SS type A sorting domain-containing protein n=1 Tax=Saccharicrinis sp. FJH65 TaxID=3344659 RepID=UPI0035F3F100